MNSEVEVGFANDKGGCGKTTGASHLLWWAEENAVPAIGITTDPQGNLIQRLLDDPKLQPDRRFQYGKYVELVFSPHHVPMLHTKGQRVVVYDYPPGLNQTYDSQLMDLWMVMIDSREAVEGLLTAMRSKSLRVKPGGKGIYAVINMYDGAGNEPVKAAIETIKSIPGVKLWPQQISDCNPIQRSAEFRKPAWKVPKGKGTIGATQMQQFCYEVFTLLGLPTKAPERRRS